MTFENHNPVPEDERSHEEITTPESIAAVLHEKVLSEGFEEPEPINEERKEQLKKDTADVATIFNKAESPWFIGGGLSLELHVGTFERDHGDFDISVYREDMSKHVDTLRSSGYELFYVTPGAEDTIATEWQLTSAVELHVKKVDENAVGPASIDLYILDNGEGDLHEAIDVFGDGRTIPLKRKELEVLNKIFGARQLDFYDLKKFLPTLTTEERQKLEKYLEEAGATFVVGDKETRNLDELLQFVDDTTRAAKEGFWETKLDEVISESLERFDLVVVKIFETAERAGSRENFYSEFKKRYGLEAATEYQTELEKFSEFLFGENKPTQEEFRTFAYQTVDLPKHMERQLKTGFVVEFPRWEVRTDR